MDNDKNQIKKEHFLECVAYLMLETFEGSPEGKGSAYLDRGIGVFSTLDGVSAEQASTFFHGTTIAAQTEHAKFYLDRICDLINGGDERIKWDDSWLIETVNPTEWEALQGSVRRSYESTLRTIAAVDDWDEDKCGMAMGMVAHSAYHLGAIRQIAKAAGPAI